ncbi:hypothetical protein GCM10007079_36620 [Nocardiopsis terrae]|uniref:Polymer-forming protein n=1 Tax=Nocardiopsis terrae TaxID=372655 RepID=A0ABR9HDE9_9ACTN|nr:hypothetical protein [Nocardiopsis terrae]MBE1457056.1 hypothetical protein [Nocardiopsis terrae]GHC90374.1 hypothetical protein GCM10007079_36620 [Nocardiopsis terrae]
MKLGSKIAASTATAALAIGGVTLMAAPAQADLVTVCSGHGGAVTLPTDLKVPAGASCFLDGTVIQGDVTVEGDANLHVLGGQIDGEVTVSSNGYFDASDTSVEGNVVNSGSYGTYLEEGTSVAGLSATAAEGADNDGFVFVVDASASSIDAQVGELYVSGARLGGVSADGTEYADIFDSVVRGDLSVSGTSSGAILCDSEVLGDATYADASGPVAVGAGEQDGFCSSVNYVDGDLSVTGVSGGVYIDNNIVGGDLTTAQNSPTAQVGDNNRVRGGIITEEVAMRTMAAEVTAEFEEHEDELEETVEEMRSETVEEAMEAGPAF